jgi:hypothetical protein
MRRIAGLVLLALGVALVALAIALPSYVYPRVQKSPGNPDAFIVARGTGMTVLLAQSEADGGIRVLTNQTVDATRRVKGELRPNAPRPTGNNVFYRQAVQLTVENQPNGLLTAFVEGASMDGKTALANNCCGDYRADDVTKPQGEPVTHEGLVWKFPFGTKKQSYPLWDGNAGKAVTATYDGTEKLHGMTTYRFVQDVRNLVLSQQQVPGALVGAPRKASVTADQVYSNITTIWVEPVTGKIINGTQQLNRRLVYHGTEVPVLQGRLVYTDATVRQQIKDTKGPAAALTFVTRTGPLLGWILGPILIVIAFGLLLPSRRQPKDHEDGDIGHSEKTADDRENQQSV